MLSHRSHGSRHRVKNSSSIPRRRVNFRAAAFFCLDSWRQFCGRRSHNSAFRLAVPECKILATSSLRHHDHLKNHLVADGVIDRNSASLPSDVKSASPGSHGVDAIVDVVGAGRTQRDIFEALNPHGAKIYAPIYTG